MRKKIAVLSFFFCFILILGCTKGTEDHIYNLTHAKSPKARAKAAEELGQADTIDVKVVETLLFALNDRDPEVRKSTATALGNIGVKPQMQEMLPKIEDPLIALLRYDKANDVRCIVAEALRKIGDKKTLEALLETIKKDENARLRWQIAVELGKMRNINSLDTLIETLLGDESIDVRRGAAWALGELGDEQALKPLREIAREKRFYEVWDKAKEAIEKIEKAE